VAKHLPPPPTNPALSPPVSVAGEEPVTIPGLPGEPSLEGRVRAGAGARRAVVLCHPHPLYGGTMHSAVVVALAKMIAERGGDDAAWIRMNTRGVGASEGRYDDGRGETSDVRAAIRELHRRAPRAAVTVCGYSFGTWVGLRAAAMEGGVERVALIAPAVRIFQFVREDGAAFQGRLAIYVGDRDEYCDVAEAKALASDLGASLQVFEGSDHFFLSSRRKLALAVFPFIVPEIEQEDGKTGRGLGL
jgi:alpha/beta superfamily hydrolase